MFKRLNKKGFSHHLIFPVLALLAVGSIGAYMTFKSNAAIPPEGWVTISTTTASGTLKPSRYVTIYNPWQSTSSSSKYRLCAVVKFSSGTSNVLETSWNNNSGSFNAQNLGSIGTSYVTKCSSGYYGKGYANAGLRNKSTNNAYISKMYWQKYY